ncbi:MAG: SMC family ATPase [Clostridia bacterium]|nr:SMC family ATPase [Clostridia bacterium]
MRPIKLTMSAFGPYADKTVIEFDRLGESGLYLITGTTGAGKTSIFDAIAYALYDKPSGDIRESSMFRSKYAAPSAETYVELEFVCKGKTYVIRRSPEYERMRIRGNGDIVKQSPKAELHLPDGSSIDKSRKEVTKAIEEIIGIDRNQFLQIAMIAQGDFLKLLLAKTEERKTIFRQIFKTQAFEKIQLQLKNDAKRLYGEWSDLNKEVLAYARNMSCHPYHERLADVQIAKEGKLPTEEIIGLLNLFIEEDREAIQRLQEKADRVKEALATINTQIGKAEELEKNKILYREKQQRYEAVQKKYETDLLTLETEKKNQPRLEALSKELTAMEIELSQYEQLDRLEKEISVLNDKLNNDAASQENNRKLFTEQEQRICRLKEKQKLFENASVQKEKLSAEMQSLQIRQNALENLLNSLNDHDKLRYELQKQQNEYLVLLSDAKHAMEKYNLAYLSFLNEQAGIIAEALQEGVPCPVCGSVHHPRLAQISHSAPSEAELKAMKKIADDMQRKSEKKSAECANFKGKIDAEMQRIQNTAAEIFGECNWMDLRETIILQKNEAIKNLLAVKEKIACEIQRMRTKEMIDKEIPIEEEKLDHIRLKQSDLEQSIIAVKEKILNRKEQTNALRASLRHETKAEASRELTSLYLKTNTLKEAWERANNAFSLSEKEISKLQGELASLKNVMDSVCEIDLQKAMEERSHCSQHSMLIQSELDETRSRLHTNAQCLEHIRSSAQKAIALEQHYRWMNQLSETANGGLNGREKIMLETYVQMKFFDRILRRANIRLRFMTNSQYELIRHKPRDEYRSQTGLDLDVKDHYNGTVRPVNTLSGGESFKASLALALGLSDEIQSTAGGIRLDTMFVDEGFGSLDDESLKLAINALRELTEGKRLVGIISHVSELKEKIEKQIVVTKERSGGSHCQIVT